MGAIYPDWALLNNTARLSELRNETTAECRTPEGHTVAVSFWLDDPPAVSQFTVHCPGLDASKTPPYVVWAEGAFVLLCVTLADRSIHHFVYCAAGENPTLQLLPNPEPNVASFRGEKEFGLLPCGGEHYAVAFLDWEWPDGETRQYYACIFSSATNTWRRSKAAPLRLSDSDQALFETYARGSSYKRITVGESAVGWVDLMSGILVACNLFDESPVMKFIPFPAERVCITYDDSDPYYAPEYFRDVVCSGDLIRFVELDFEYPVHRANGSVWTANTWSMKLDWDDWRRRCTVDVRDVSVDMSYSALLPGLLDEVTGRMRLKNLYFLTPTLSVHSDNLLYMLAKADGRDATAWVVVVDMKRAVADAIVPVSTKSSDAITLYCSCALPRYYPVPDDGAVKTDDDSEDGDSMQGDEYWRENWCDESLAQFSDEEEEEDPIIEEEEDPIKENKYPNWALLNKTARLSELRNQTTAECSTPDGQPIAVSFWLADPPAISQFTVHCPGLDASGQPPYIICAEGAFLLFCVTLVDRSVHHFVYSAAGNGKNPSLHLLPDPEPNVTSFPGKEEFGLLPHGGCEHYAVAFLDWEWPQDSQSHGNTQYYVCVFSSEANTWKRSKAAPLQLSHSDQALFDDYARGSYKQITVGESAVGWVDFRSGILLACNLFDERPVMKFIPFPAASACITYDGGNPYYGYAPEYLRDVVCSGDLIRFVELDFDDPDYRTNGNVWRATTWNMKLDWDDWRRRYTVNIDDVLVDRSYSALLPELLDEETGQMVLKTQDFFTPTLSVHNDNLLYMLAKVDQRDATAWVIVVDMKRVVADAIVPVYTKPSDGITLYCSCALPSYYPVPDDDAVKTDDGSEDGDSTQGDDYWRRNWCDESLEGWSFSEEDEDPVIEEDEDPDKKEDEEDVNSDKKEDENSDKKEDEEGQTVKASCHKTNVGADMSNRVGTDYKSHEMPQGSSDPDDNSLNNEHQHKKKKRRKRTRSSRRKKKQALVQDNETELLYLLRFIGCILIVIIIRASIAAFPAY